MAMKDWPLPCRLLTILFINMLNYTKHSNAKFKIQDSKFKIQNYVCSVNP